MEQVMDRLRNPQDTFPSIHIAGTNGKGSVAAMLASILRESGLTVGLYTSPHLEKINERFQINGAPISDACLSGLIRRLRESCRPPSLKQVSLKQVSLEQGSLTQFEFLTALAFLWFAEEKVDVAVVEVGLGGRLDATNIMNNVILSVITTIDLEHREWLGPTITSIAREKAGIIKPFVPVVTGASGAALREIKRAVRRHGVRPNGVHRNGMRRNGVPVSAVPVNEHRRFPYRLGLKGSYQKTNGAIALACIPFLREFFPNIHARHVAAGLAKTVWPARFESLAWRSGKDTFSVLLDGAHNPAAAKALVCSLKEKKIRKVNLLFGVLRDKDYKTMARMLAPVVDRGVIVPVPSDRSALPSAVANQRAWKGRMRAAQSIQDGMNLIKRFPRENPILITGSLYLIGALRKQLIGPSS